MISLQLEFKAARLKHIIAIDLYQLSDFSVGYDRTIQTSGLSVCTCFILDS